MTEKIVEKFKKERAALSERALDTANLEIKRFYSLDSQAYATDQRQTY